MSNLTIYILCLIFSLLFIGLFYFLIKKWSKFHLTLFGKVLKVLYAALLLIGVVGTLTGAYLTFSEYWEYDRVRVVNEYDGIQLGLSKDEVLFRKGEPLNVGERDDGTTSLTYESTYIFINKDRVVGVGVMCGYEIIGGVRCRDELSRVIELYGESKELDVSDDKLVRFYNYPQYNLSFMLEKSEVTQLWVLDSKFFPKGYGLAEKSRGAWTDEEVIEKVPPIDQQDSNSTAKVDEPKLNELDHCAPNISKAERLKRLALKGVVRQTSDETYTAGNNEIVYAGGSLISCR